SFALQIGDDVAATDLRGHLAVSLHAFDPREVHGLDVLGQVTTTALFDGQLAGVEFLRRMLPAGVVVQAAAGPLHADLRVDHGKVSAGSAADLRTPRLFAELPQLRAEAQAVLALRVPGAHGTLALELGSLSLAPA